MHLRWLFGDSAASGWTDGRTPDKSALEKLRCLSAGGAKNIQYDANVNYNHLTLYLAYSFCWCTVCLYCFCWCTVCTVSVGVLFVLFLLVYCFCWWTVCTVSVGVLFVLFLLVYCLYCFCWCTVCTVSAGVLFVLFLLVDCLYCFCWCTVFTVSAGGLFVLFLLAELKKFRMMLMLTIITRQRFLVFSVLFQLFPVHV